MRIRLLARLPIAFAAAFSAAAPMPARAQADRQELGRRLLDFEERWSRPAETGDRGRAADALNESVGRFFRMEYGEAARAMTRARHLLDGIDEPPAAVRWAESLTIAPGARLVERGRPSLEARIVPVYPVDDATPAGARARIVVAVAGETNPRTLLEIRIDANPLDVSIPAADLPEGDHTLRLDLLAEDELAARVESGLSVVDRLADRLEAAGRTIASVPAGGRSPGTDVATARQHAQLLANLAAGAATEANVPASALIGELEHVLGAIGSGRPFHGPDRAGSHRLALVTPEGRTVPARVLVPEGIAGDVPVPLVVALHGMGGSENLFFEGYGRGAIVDLCRDRGWLLVSPRRGPVGSGPIDEVIESMAALYPVDRSRVLLIGHSMGATQSIDALGRSPDRFAAVAALGGGGRVVDGPGIARVPIFIGIGAGDFLLPRARGLREALAGIGSERVEYREYPDVEHLVIVQAALRDVFAFFDDQIAGSPAVAPGR